MRSNTNDGLGRVIATTHFSHLPTLTMPQEKTVDSATRVEEILAQLEHHLAICNAMTTPERQVRCFRIFLGNSYYYNWKRAHESEAKK